MNPIDIGIFVFLLIAILVGLKKGFVASVISLAALVISIIIVSQLSPVIVFFLVTKFNLSEIIAVIISYLVVFIFIAIIAKILIKILHKIIKKLKISALNRILGAILGLCNGLIILIIMVLLINLTPFEEDFVEATSDSQAVTSLRLLADKISQEMPDLKSKQEDAIDELIKKVNI
ncbi:MAG: CvpA family protein [Candidatus Cloacimonetes bacterium]|nr:CvpA family protein [Candidatus Cloacimonadota bacterium]